MRSRGKGVRGDEPGVRPSLWLAPPATDRAAITILELLVSVGIIGLLAALVLPALGAAREAARRTTCTSQLRQVGLALHSYEDTQRSLPVGWQPDATQSRAQGWAVAILPHLEQRSLYQQISPKSEWRHDAAWEPLTLLQCPSDLIEPNFDLFLDSDGADDDMDTAMPRAAPAVASESLMRLPTANYVGVFGNSEPDDGPPVPVGEGAFIESRPVKLAEFRRGLSNTVVVGERTMAQLPSTWLGFDLRGEDAPCRVVGNAATSPNCSECDECEFSSRHPGGVGFLYGDGHVELIADDVDAQVYRARARRLEF